MEYFRGFVRGHMQAHQPEPAERELPSIKAPTLAKLSEDVYRSGGDAAALDGFRRLTPEELTQKGIAPESLHTKSGMHAEVYGDDHGRAVLAYRGTVNPSVSVVTQKFDGGSGIDTDADMYNMLRGGQQGLRFNDVAQSARDWSTNLRQGLGLETAQHNDAVALGKQVNQAFGANNVALTGHSKGGGEAQLVGALFGNPTVTFNSAAPHDDTLRRFGLDPAKVREDAPRHIDSIITKGEAVDRLQGQQVSAAPLLKAMISSSQFGEYGDNGALTDRIKSQDLTFRTPTTLGRRFDLQPEPGMSSISLHLMGKGVLPYASQMDGIEVMGPKKPAMEVGSSSQVQSPPSSYMQDFLSGLYGRFGEASRQLAQPTLSDERHPANGLHRQALGLLHGQGVQGRDAERLAGALTVESQQGGLTRIDAVTLNQSGKVFAVQDPQSEWSRHVYVDPDQAKRTPLSESSIASANLARDPIQVQGEQPSIKHEHNRS